MRASKHNFELLTGNLMASNIYSHIKVIPSIELTTKSLLSFFKMDKSSYKTDIEMKIALSDKLFSVLIDDTQSYKLYLYTSTNYPSQVYDDKSKYSQSFRNAKMRQNVRFILNTY